MAYVSRAPHPDSLLAAETRTAGGFRLYTEDQVDRLALIKQMKPLGFTVQEMREHLDASDTLRSERDGDAAATAAAARLAEYAEVAAERCAKLTAQLRQAEGLAGQLRREAQDHRPAPRATP